MFKLPSILPYPHVDTVDKCPEIVGQFCYVINDYKPGIAVIIKVEGDESGTSFGDWSGAYLDQKSALWSRADEFLTKYNVAISRLLRQIQVPQAELFISADGKLVDVQISLNKFIGPGMLRDLFSKILPTQEVVEIVVIDKAKLRKLKGVVLKPSRFRTLADQCTPLYARI